MFKTAWSVFAVIAIIAASFVSNAPPSIFMASVVGVVFVLTVAFKNNIAPLLGALLSLIYGYLSFENHFYANAVMNILILVPLQMWGYFHWVVCGDKTYEIQAKTKKWMFGLTVIGMIIATIFSYLSGSAMFYLDGPSSVLVITSTVLLSLKLKEQWYGWIPYNVIECIMWFGAMSLEPSVIAIFVMRVIFLVNSLIGAHEWTKTSD